MCFLNLKAGEGALEKEDSSVGEKEAGAWDQMHREWSQWAWVCVTVQWIQGLGGTFPRHGTALSSGRITVVMEVKS